MSYPLLEMLKRHEGFKDRPYLDTVNVLTIGYGRNLETNPLTEDEATYLLVNDIERHERALWKAFPVAVGLDHVRRDALINMAFNLGIPRLRGFKKMWAAIEISDWPRAAAEAMDSKWARQVGRRAEEIAFMLRTGQYP
jgi:lysozyme